jgi:hypothetical protein
LVGIASGVEGLAILLAVNVLTNIGLEALEELAKRKSAVVVWQFTEDHISTRSELATAEISCKLIQKVWRFPEVWLLFFFKE